MTHLEEIRFELRKDWRRERHGSLIGNKHSRVSLYIFTSTTVVNDRPSVLNPNEKEDRMGFLRLASQNLPSHKKGKVLQIWALYLLTEGSITILL